MTGSGRDGDKQFQCDRMKQGQQLYSGRKGTMKRLLTAALCQLADAAGSSMCQLGTGTANNSRRNSLNLFTETHSVTVRGGGIKRLKQEGRNGPFEKNQLAS